MVTKRGRLYLLLAAGVLIAAALIGSLLLDRTSESARLCRTINSYGYSILPGDLYPAASWEEQSIRALLPGTGLDAAVSASVQAGFPSDIDRVGTVSLVMAKHTGDDVITLYLVDGEIELGFVQTAGSEHVRTLGGE